MNGKTFLNTNQHVWSSKSHLLFGLWQSSQHLNKCYYYILNLLLKKSFTSSKLTICISKQSTFWAKSEWKNDFSVHPDCSSEASLAFLKPESCISTLLEVLPVHPVHLGSWDLWLQPSADKAVNGFLFSLILSQQIQHPVWKRGFSFPLWNLHHQIAFLKSTIRLSNGRITLPENTNIFKLIHSSLKKSICKLRLEVLLLARSRMHFQLARLHVVQNIGYCS